VEQLQPEGLVTRTQRTGLVQVKYGHLETSPIECLDRTYRVQLGTANVERIDAIGHTDGARERPRRIRCTTRGRHH